MECGKCGVWVHKKCCGLNRWERDRVENWRCVSCVGSITANEDRGRDQSPGRPVDGGQTHTMISERPGNETAGPGMNNVERPKCGCCRRVVARGCGVRCCRCEEAWHLKCVFTTRGQTERVDRSSWKCGLCFAEEGRVCVERDIAVHQRSGVKEMDGEGSIRVLQWNVDQLRAKVPELEVWLREHRVDVACL